MTFKFFNRDPLRLPVSEPVINPDSGEIITSGADYNVISQAKFLSESDVGGYLHDNASPAQSSAFILNSFDLVLVQELNDKNLKLSSGLGLPQKSSEKLKKTSDINPNRDEKDKFSSLKSGRVDVSKIFDNRTTNSINELDQNRSLAFDEKPKVPDILTPLADDFIKHSPKTLVSRITK